MSKLARGAANEQALLHLQVWAARAHMLYSRDEVIALYGISRNTLANWERQGLRRVDPPVRASVTSPGTRLYLGQDLNALHAKRRADSKRPSVGDQTLLPAMPEASVPERARGYV
jgi:DNA-binding XRE family transcriptional regulator